ncbi:MAG: hypothetical protein C5S49_06205 [Candidatus Methanogaster sp.]|nr:MAG: hypothetical protein C5S49_06205 [ANME-2 cluster archaeon]
MEAKTVHEGAGNRTYNAAERQTVQHQFGLVGLLVYATRHGFTSGTYSLLLLCRRCMGEYTHYY